MSRNRGYVYMLVTADAYEIPAMIADSLAELSSLSGISNKTLATARLKNSKIQGKYYIRRINANKSSAAAYAEKKKLIKLNDLNSEADESDVKKTKKVPIAKKNSKMEK